MNSARFQAAFEETSRDMLQTAHDFVDHGEDVATIWIYLTLENGFLSSGVAYRISGQICLPQEVDQALAQTVDARANIGDIVYPISDLLVEFYQSVKDLADLPTRIVIGYDVPNQRMDADFGYDPIDNNTDDDLLTVKDKWMANLKATGEAKAAFLP